MEASFVAGAGRANPAQVHVTCKNMKAASGVKPPHLLLPIELCNKRQKEPYQNKALTQAQFNQTQPGDHRL